MSRLRLFARRAGVAFGWRLGGMCGVWANKTPPAKALSCKALRHVWRLWRLFLTLIWKHKPEDDTPRLPAIRTLGSGKADKAPNKTPHMPHTPQTLAPQGFHGVAFALPKRHPQTQNATLAGESVTPQCGCCCDYRVTTG